MNPIFSLLARARRRLFVSGLLVGLVWSATVAASAILIVLLLERALGFETDWPFAWAVAGGATVLSALIVALATLPDRLSAARRVDEGADLRETVSTALLVSRGEDAWSRATLDRAVDVASRVNLAQALPIRAPRRWAAPLAPLAAFALAWALMPQMDVLGRLAEQQEEARARAEAEAVAQQVESAERELATTLASIGEESLLDAEANRIDEPVARTPEAIRREAVKKLTSVADRMQQIRQSPEARSVEEMQRRMADLRQPGRGELNDFVAKLQRGDFGGAKQALDELANKMAAGELSPEQKAALEQQMKSLAEQMDQLADKQGDLERQLEQLGIDKSLAQNPEALQDALEGMEGLTPGQMQSLMQQAQAMKQAQGQCQNMAGAMAQGAGGMGELSEQLSQLEMAQAQAGAAGAAMAQALAQLDQIAKQEGAGGDLFSMFPEGKAPPGQQGAWSAGDGSGGAGGQGSQGGRGQGRGATGSAAEGAFALKQQKARTQGEGGPVVGVMLVDGVQVRGEARATAQAVTSAAAEAAGEAIEDRRVPREHHEAIKRYFGRLERAVSAQPAQDAQPTPAPADQADD